MTQKCKHSAKTYFNRQIKTYVIILTYVLNMVEAQRGPPSCVLQRLSGESFIMAVNEAEKVEANILLNL